MQYTNERITLKHKQFGNGIHFRVKATHRKSIQFPQKLDISWNCSKLISIILKGNKNGFEN